MASNSAVDMCGHAYLYRREERRRWLLLTGDTLFVFADLPQFTPVASLDLRCARLVATSAPRELQLHTAGRDYHLRASDDATCADWRAALEDGGGGAAAPTLGWLEKRGARNTGFKRRFFVLDPDARVLSYFRELPEPAPLSAIPLAALRALPRQRDVTRAGRRQHGLVLETAEGTVFLGAEGEQERDAWVAALRRAVHAGGFARQEAVARIQRWARRQQRWRRGEGVGASDGRASGLPRTSGVISSLRKNSSDLADSVLGRFYRGMRAKLTTVDADDGGDGDGDDDDDDDNDDDDDDDGDGDASSSAAPATPPDSPLARVDVRRFIRERPPVGGGPRSASLVEAMRGGPRAAPLASPMARLQDLRLS